MPGRDKELGYGGSAAGTLTPSSRRSSLVSGQLLHYPINSTVLEEPVEEKVSPPGVLGPTVIDWVQCPVYTVLRSWESYLAISDLCVQT